MTIFNLGSVNIDHFYDVAHLPKPGETLAASGHMIGLGGKGVNQSVASARAGADVRHIGAISEQDTWVRERLLQYGVGCTHLHDVNGTTGHAIIYVDATGENTIVLEGGGNTKLTQEFIQQALIEAHEGDLLLLQNETNQQIEAAKAAYDLGLRVVYSAAPFDVIAIKGILPHASLIVMNEVESAQFSDALDQNLEDFRGADLLVTLGSKGALWQSGSTGERIEVSAPIVDVVDTTAAGDTFLGYVAAGLDLGKDMQTSMEWGVRAAGLKVTRKGTADAIPSADEVIEFYR